MTLALFLAVAAAFSRFSSTAGQRSALRPLLPRAPAQRLVGALASLSDDVDQLQGLVLPRASAARSAHELDQIRHLFDKLSHMGDGRQYITDGSLYGNFEVAFFDRSVDGDRSKQTSQQKSLEAGARQSSGFRNATRPFGLRSKMLGSLFSLRHSFQHVVEPNVVVNFVGFCFMGLPASVVARGFFTPLNDTAIAAIQAAHGTALRPSTSVRIVFDSPLVTLGPLSFELGSFAAQPPVDICFTYVDERVRLGLAARGGKFVFTRGGLADAPYADDWQKLLARPPMSGRGVATVLAALGAVLGAALPAVRRPLTYAALAMVALVAVKSADAKRRGRREQKVATG